MIEGHGDDIYRYGGKVKHNFSSNICQGSGHKALAENLADNLGCIFNYPEPAPVSIEELIAQRNGVPANCVMATNGAADAIYIMAHAWQRRISAIMQPTFSEYADACEINGHVVKQFSRLVDLPANCDVVWICNPNNPTGNTLDAAALLGVVRSNPDKIFVIDQSYHKYTAKPVLPPRVVNRHPNLILLYSLTKDYCIPGLRLGYMVANPTLIGELKRFRTPWSVNALAIAAAKFLLVEDSGIDRDALLQQARYLADALTAMGIVVTPSDTNFILCRLPKGTAAELKQWLVEHYGILIRDASNFVGLTPRHFRIAAQEPDENELLIKAIEIWMES